MPLGSCAKSSSVTVWTRGELRRLGGHRALIVISKEAQDVVANCLVLAFRDEGLQRLVLVFGQLACPIREGNVRTISHAT